MTQREPLACRLDYDRLLKQEASYFPRASTGAVERLLASSLPEEAQWIAKMREGYPEELYLVDEAPDVLVYEGDLSLLSRQVRLVVAGSRGASTHTQSVTESTCCRLAEDGVTILGGMVSAIDMAAHRGSLLAKRHHRDAPTRSAAIVAAPLGAPWPSGRHELGRAIYAAGGLLVSLTPQVRGLALDECERRTVQEYRQRFTAALSTAVLIMHANPNGYTEKLINAALTLERPVLIWYEILENAPAFLEALLAKAPKDHAGRELIIVVKNAKDIEAATTAWQLVWWL